MLLAPARAPEAGGLIPYPSQLNSVRIPVIYPV